MPPSPDHAAEPSLHDLIDTSQPGSFHAEVSRLVRELHPNAPLAGLDKAYRDTCELFRGNYSGYRASNTAYHDLQHTLEVFLCTARILHGAAQTGNSIALDTLQVALLAALFHDSGLLQTADDLDGTGAKYTIGHEKRSIRFATEYIRTHAYSQGTAERVALMISTTELTPTPAQLNYPSRDIGFAANAVATADLLAQMADREYLEKLLLLFLEFQEAGQSYQSMYDLLCKTHGFYKMAQHRLTVDLDNVGQHLRAHFKARWQVDSDLYKQAIAKNLAYLDIVLQEGENGFLNRLNRGNIHAKLARLTNAGSLRAD